MDWWEVDTPTADDDNYDSNSSSFDKPDVPTRSTRVYIPKGRTTKLMFLDFSPRWVLEHQIKRRMKSGDEWVDTGNWFDTYFYVTCRASAPNGKGCPACDDDCSRSRRGYLTVWEEKESQKGNIYWSKKPYVITNSTWQLLEHKIGKFGDLRFHEFMVFRTKADKSPSAGNNFDFTGKVYTKEELAQMIQNEEVYGEGDLLQPFDYSELISPVPYEEFSEKFETGEWTSVWRKNDDGSSATAKEKTTTTEDRVTTDEEIPF